jgi:hypothetical protein
VLRNYFDVFPGSDAVSSECDCCVGNGFVWNSVVGERLAVGICYSLLTVTTGLVV